MMENYVYPDTHEMFDLHDTLEELISKESYDNVINFNIVIVFNHQTTLLSISDFFNVIFIVFQACQFTIKNNHTITNDTGT